jgi:hypothetical protein
VSYFMREYDSAAHGSAVSMTPLCMSQRCQSHCCATNFVALLRKYEAIFKTALTRVSGALGELYEKNRGRKSRVRVTLRNHTKPLDI